MSRIIAVIATLAVLVSWGAGCDRTPRPTGVHVAATDDTGIARFTDNQTGEEVVITVVGGPRNEAVSGARLSFIDSDGYEAFVVSDPDGVWLPHLEVYPHNSAHTLSLTPAARQGHVVRELPGVAAQTFLEDLGEGCSETVYVTAEQAETRNKMESWLILPFAGEVLRYLGIANKGVKLLDVLSNTPETQCYLDCWVLRKAGTNLHAPIRVTTPADAGECGIDGQGVGAGGAPAGQGRTVASVADALDPILGHWVAWGAEKVPSERYTFSADRVLRFPSGDRFAQRCSDVGAGEDLAACDGATRFVPLGGGVYDITGARLLPVRGRKDLGGSTMSVIVGCSCTPLKSHPPIRVVGDQIEMGTHLGGQEVWNRWLVRDGDGPTVSPRQR